MKKVLVVLLMLLVMFSTTNPCVAVADEQKKCTDYSTPDETSLNFDAMDTSVIMLRFEIKAKQTGKKPFYGKSEDYTKKQNVRKKDIRFDQIVQVLTGSAVALMCAPITGGLSFVDVGNAAVTLARIYNSKTKTMYYTKIQYGHKKLPGIYHKYVTTWYLDAKRTQKVNKKSVYYDANM